MTISFPELHPTRMEGKGMRRRIGRSHSLVVPRQKETDKVLAGPCSKRRFLDTVTRETLAVSLTALCEMWRYGCCTFLSVRKGRLRD